MDRTLRVGIIGTSAERGWARISHVPAVRGLAGIELAAVVTRDQPSAERAAKAFGARAAYADPRQLFADPDIDIATCCSGRSPRESTSAANTRSGATARDPRRWPRRRGPRASTPQSDCRRGVTRPY